MKRPYFLLLLTALAALSGYLLSRASLAGRAGISLFYKEYSFLKTWWQGALVVLAVWLLLFGLQSWVHARAKTATGRLVHTGAVVLAVVGLYFTYRDFHYTLSHKLLGERFHLGGYLFWIGWMLICLYFLTKSRKTTVATID